MDPFLNLPTELTTGLLTSLARDELTPAHTTGLVDLPTQRAASFLTLPSELRQQILKITFEECIPKDLAQNLFTIDIEADYSYITDAKRAETGRRTLEIRRQLVDLTKACPAAASDSIHCAIYARKRYLELFEITMQIWKILKAERGNTLTLGNLSRFVKTDGLLTSIHDVPRIKERFRLYH